MKETKLGILIGFGAYISWGLLPLFWKLLADIESGVVLSYRIFWTCITMLLYMLVSRSSSRYKKEFKTLFSKKKSLIAMFVASAFISLNWLLYIYSITSGHATDASLGYYIMPLFSVLLSFVFLKEKFSRIMLVAVALASIGVMILVLRTGQLPIIALLLALLFALYGLIKKQVVLSSDVAMLMESALVLPFALGYFFFFSGHSLFDFSLRQHVLLALSGVVTALPLLLFAESLKRAPLNIVGFIQYVSPTIQLILAITVFGEPFVMGQLLGFIFIWLAILAFVIGQVLLISKK